jgi:hypothetical protein
MTDQSSNVFNQEVKQPEAQPASNALSPDASYADLLAMIKNEEGKQKYDSLPKALEGLVNAQQFIPQLKTELQQKEAELVELRSKLAQQASVEEVVSRLTAQAQQPKAQDTPSQASGLDEQAVMNLVQQTLAQREQQSVSASNSAQVQSALVAKYGDKAGEMVAQRAAALGTTTQKLGELASQNPQLVLELFNTSASKGPTPTTTSVNTSGFNAPVSNELKKPERSLLGGATAKQQTEYMRLIREKVYRDNGITE